MHLSLSLYMFWFYFGWATVDKVRNIIMIDTYEQIHVLVLSYKLW